MRLISRLTFPSRRTAQVLLDRKQLGAHKGI
jgi:hypothetical protein